MNAAWTPRGNLEVIVVSLTSGCKKIGAIKLGIT